MQFEHGMLQEKASLSTQAQTATPTPGTGLRLTRQARHRRARQGSRDPPWLRGPNKQRFLTPWKPRRHSGNRPQLHWWRWLGQARTRSGGTGRLLGAHALPPRHSDHGFRDAVNCTGSRRGLRTVTRGDQHGILFQ